LIISIPHPKSPVALVLKQEFELRVISMAITEKDVSAASVPSMCTKRTARKLLRVRSATEHRQTILDDALPSIKPVADSQHLSGVDHFRLPDGRWVIGFLEFHPSALSP